MTDVETIKETNGSGHLLPPSKKEKLLQDCPYLDTINRNLIDFDFEKICSISLSNQNIYACLVCGKYFQGRGIKSHAYTHSLQEAHYVFLNLSTEKFYCLPENYEFFDSSLDDIIYMLHPVYHNKDIPLLNSDNPCYAFDGSKYFTGIIGINNIKANDYCNVILMALAHLVDIRDFFLLNHQLKPVPGKANSQLVMSFTEFVRKLWNIHNFRNHISPHEIMTQVMQVSKKKFQHIEQKDPAEFLIWFLNNLDIGLKDIFKGKNSIIKKCFQGKIKVTSKKIPLPDLSTAEKQQLLKTIEYQDKSQTQSFFYLPCDLPPMPLYPDELKTINIPTVSMETVLKKFDGESVSCPTTHKEMFHKKFILEQLPEYLILVYKRFSSNRFLKEKIPTIIEFPLNGINLIQCIDKENKDTLKYLEYSYDIAVNILHEGKIDHGIYKIQLYHEWTKKWFEVQDLNVKEILPQEVMLSESYIQFLKRKK